MVTLPIDLGAAAAQLGVGVDAAATLALQAGLHFDFTLGIDLAPGLPAAEAFFIRVRELEATGKVQATDLDFGITAGFLAAGVQSGTVELDAALSASFVNPDQDAAGRITLGE